MQRLADAAGLAVLAVGFSPPAALAALAEHLGWRGAFLVDEQRVLYARLGLAGRRCGGCTRRGTLARYAVAAARGHRLQRPAEDTRQLGGDAVLVDGTVVRRFLPRSPDDRVDPDRLVAAASVLR